MLRDSSSRTVRALFTLVAIYSASLPVIAGAAEATAPLPAGFFAESIKPLLAEHCVECHSGPKPKGELRLTSRQALLAGGESGDAVDLEAPDESLLISALHYDAYEMPPTGQLSAEQIALVARWLKAGAPWPQEEEFADDTAGEGHQVPQVNEQTKAFWSFQPLKRVPVPELHDEAAFALNEIDHFILRRLREVGLSPNPTAPPRALARRAHYGLLGLPPTPEWVEQFAAEATPATFAEVVDELLQSPHYGEKWGRHWLDLVRYAETNSYERDATKPNTWRYRDYVIRSLNQDKPYDQFVREQLAGDEMRPRSPDQLVATGFLRLGIWDDEPADEAQALYDDLDDMLTTTSQVFLGLTINCARCHDHKLDPMPQEDYYRLLAFFSGMHRFGGPGRNGRDFDYSQVPMDQPPELASTYRERKKKFQEDFNPVEKKLRDLEKRLRDRLPGGENDDFDGNANARSSILKKFVPKIFSEEEVAQYDSLKEKHDAALKSFSKSSEFALAATEIGTKARPMHLLIRGNPHSPAKLVEPGFPQVLGFENPELPERTPEFASSGRRTILADWIASPRNPLTARVIVNRIWQHHFGRGLVATPNNFGLQGEAPSHPELLDWLANKLIENDWRWKPIHRLIMNSATYQMSSADNPAALVTDPLNRWRWRFNMRRLSAEEIRDSLLMVSRQLNRKMFGPSIYPEIPAEVLAGQSRPGEGWGKSPPTEQNRRSVYIFVKRSLIDPMIERFDGADTDFTCPVRFATTQPTQALSMMNGPYVHERAAELAAAAAASAGEELSARIDWVLLQVMQRPPKDEEVGRSISLVRELQNEEGVNQQAAFRYFCVVALNLNEFLFLD